ncbi:MAG: efflux RND transporter periplasmic adaptor subunit [Burkholderiales bacterium]|nr:efflux RND transporter periplasmic adaptor subunit [Burkholderiales bacterium]
MNQPAPGSHLPAKTPPRREGAGRHRAAGLGTFIVTVAGTALLAACAKPAPAPEPVRAVRTMTVATGVATGTHDFAAEVRARTESRLGFRVAGKMVSRQVEAGQRVKAGQVLAQLDAGDLRLGQEAAAAAAQAASTQYELAAAEFKRFQELRAQGFISAWELERRETSLKATKAQADQARAQSEVQRNQAGYAALTATAAGVITGVDAEPGTVLAAGTPVMRLAHDGPRDAVFAVPEDGVAAVRSLLGRKDALQVRAWGSPAVMPATVREVAAAADPATRTFQVKADLGAAAVQLGQTLTVSIEQPPKQGITKLPLTAVMQQQGQTAVWLLDPASMTVKVQPVVVAGAEGNDVVVSSGLSAGQVVVTAGVHVLTPGQKVKYYAAAADPGRGAVPVASGGAPGPASVGAAAMAPR